MGSQGIYGEKLWLLDRSQVTQSHRAILWWLLVLGSVGFVLLGRSLVKLHVWPTVFGATLVVVVQLWRIDRMGLLYAEKEHAGTAELDRVRRDSTAQPSVQAAVHASGVADGLT
ncbi:MAG TPA: DUF6653 family protein [Dehalococcoidia bacterium]|nr:DUF6653 family protein [Dehalococcoidia bacterium]